LWTHATFSVIRAFDAARAAVIAVRQADEKVSLKKAAQQAAQNTWRKRLLVAIT
jgi:hypothetical protein